MAYCSSCGTQFRDGARFCETCGQAAPAPAAVPVATPAQTGPVDVQAPAPGYGPQPLAEGGPAWSIEAPASPPAAAGKSRRGLVTAIGGVAAVGVLGVVGYFVYDQLAGPSGGAATPTAAVMELSAAADAEDAVTALSLLPPGEVGPIVDLYEDVEAKATTTGVASADNPFAGFDLQLTDVRVETEQLGEDVAAVTITSGTVSWALDPDQLQGALRIDPNGEVRRATDGSADLVELTRNASDGAPLRLMTVQRGGKWYVSPMYTLLELWRANQGLPAPDFSRELDFSGTGADSAGAAVEQAAQTLAAYDAEGFLDLLSPDEAAALYQYRDAIVTALHRDGALAELQSEVGLSVDSIDTAEGEEVDGRVPVAVRSASGSLVDDDGDYYAWALDRNCVSYSENGDSDGACLDELFTELGLGSDLASRFQSLTILTQEVDGRWYLSPLATLVADARDVVAELDADDVAGAIGVPQFGGVDGQLSDGTTAEASLDDPYEAALFEMDVPAGKVLSACTDDSGGWWIAGPDGRPTGSGAVLAADGGRYRFVVFGGGESSSVNITPALSDVQEVAVPSTVAPADGGCGNRMLSVAATAGQPLVFDTGVEIITPGGDIVWGSAYTPTESGPLLVVAPADQEVSVEALPDDVLTAGSTVTGSLDSSGTAILRVFVGAGQQIEIGVVGDGTVEPSLELYSAEGFSVDFASADPYSSSVSVFHYNDDASQIYELVISDYWATSGTFEVTVTGY